MEISQALSPSNRNFESSASETSALSSDFETFLVMLTTQMENQDPLNPIESSDFAVQLATFSGVEQQVRTNDLLASMSASNTMADLSSWVGLNARTEGPVRFDGAPVLIHTGEETNGLTRRLNVRASDGTLVSTEAIPSGVRELEWAGRSGSGAILPSGSYILTVDQMRGEEIIKSQEAASYSLVIEARRARGGTELVLANGAVVDAAEVDALRSSD